MTYRLSTDPDPPSVPEMRAYLAAFGLHSYLAMSTDADGYFVADALFRLVGPDPKRVPEALALLNLVEAAKRTGESVKIDPPAGTIFIAVGRRQYFGDDLAEICSALTARLAEEDEAVESTGFTEGE